MKKLSSIILGFIIGAALTYYFCPRQVTDNEMQDTKIVKPKGVISVKDAIVLNNNWTRSRKAAVDSAAGKVDYRWTAWSLEDIRDYLNYAEKECTNLGYTMDGVQVYLGVYGNNQTEDKAGYTTMFMAPTGTKSISKGSMIPINPIRLGGNPPVPPLNQGGGGSGGYPQ